MAMLKEESGVTRNVRKSFEEAGLECNPFFTTSQMYSIERFIEMNIAGGFLPEATIAHNPIIRGYAVSFSATGHISVFWRKDRHMFLSVKRFLDTAMAWSEKKASPE